MSARAEQEEEQVYDEKHALVYKELLDDLELRQIRLCLKDHQEENRHRHLSEEVLAELA